MGEGFPLWSLAPMAWEGESHPEIGSISLFLRSRILPWHRFFYIQRSVTPIGLKPSPRFFLQKLAFLQPKKSSNRLTRGPRGSGARLLASWPPRAPSRVDSSSHILQIFQKYSPSIFIPFGLRLIWGFCETKNMQQTGTGTGHWINMLVPKIV